MSNNRSETLLIISLDVSSVRFSWNKKVADKKLPYIGKEGKIVLINVKMSFIQMAK